MMPILVMSVISLSGCASTQHKNLSSENDTLETVNRASFVGTEFIDKYIIKPVAEKYVEITPPIYRTKVTNFFGNATYLNVAINAFLQGKFKQGLSDTGRFATNSIFGVAGLFDVATGMGLEEHEDDIGKTLTTWGVTSGPYIYVPIFGPYTARNTTDIASSMLLSPLRIVVSGVYWPFTVLDAINTRANLLETTRLRDTVAVDAYAFTREAYLQQREYFLYGDDPPASDQEELFDFDDDGTLHIE